jgi:NAD(P)H-hydrate epimerase
MLLVTASEMQAMDRLTIDSFGIPGRVLMENAGRGATQFLLERFAGSMKTSVGVIAGKRVSMSASICWPKARP